MNRLIYQIYSGEYDFTLERDNKQQELDRKIYAEWDKGGRMFGEKFMDQLFHLEGKREEMREFPYFRKGFQLGARLMLEALTAATG